MTDFILENRATESQKYYENSYNAVSMFMIIMSGHSHIYSRSLW